jgi:signal transduction histidine kinase
MKQSLRRAFPILIIDGIIGIICLFGVFMVVEKPGMDVLLRSTESGLIVKKVYSAEAAEVFRIDDRVLTIDGYEVTIPEQVEFIIDGKLVGDSVALTVDRRGIEMDLTVDLAPHYSPAYLIIMLITGLTFFSFAIFVLIRCPFEQAARLFHHGSVAVAIIILTTWGNYAVLPQWLSILSRTQFSTAYVFAPVFFLHFAIIFPRPGWMSRKKIVIAFYIIAGIIAFLLSVTFILAAPQRSMFWADYFLTLFDMCRIFFSTCIILAVASIVSGYFTAREEMERRKLRWIMLGLAVGTLSFIFFWQLPSVIISHGIVAEEVILLLMLFIPLTFAVSIVRYHIFDIDLIFRRTTVYITVLIILLGVYALCIGLVSLFLGALSVSTSILVSAGTAILLAFLYEPLRGRVILFVDRVFFHVQYNYREAMNRISEELKGMYDLDTLAESLIDHLDRYLQVDRISVWLKNTGTNGFDVLAHKNYGGDFSEKMQTAEKLISSGNDKPSALTEHMEPGILFYPLSSEVSTYLDAAVIVPLRTEKRERIGYILLGRKKAGIRFSVEDIDLVLNVSSQTELAIDRILLQRKLLFEQAESQRLEELNRMKSFFVSSVSHDLKTPLTSIRMFAEMLLHEEKMPVRKSRQYLHVIEGETERLKRLIDNVLDYAKIERGAMEYNPAPMPVNRLVKNVLRLFKYQFTIHDCTVRTSFTSPDRMVHADADAMTEALINIVSNAVKYSHPGSEIIVSTVLRQERIFINIADNGAGIAEVDLPRVLEPFFRSSGEGAREEGGVGLGLAIVKYIVDAHKGNVDIKSKPGKGTTVTVSLPVLPADEAGRKSKRRRKHKMSKHTPVLKMNHDGSKGQR